MSFLRIAHRGFSTIEMLIAMTLLVFALSTTVLLSFGNRSLALDSEIDAEGRGLAEKLLEAARARARHDFRLVNPSSGEENIDGRIYAYTTDVIPRSDFLTKEVKTTVSWRGIYGRMQKASLLSLVTNYENAGGDTCYSTLIGNWNSPQTAHVLFGGIAGIDDKNGAYPISDIDVYEKKLYVALRGSAIAAGPKNPASGTSNSAVGTRPWSNEERIIQSDSSAASALMSGLAGTHYLKASNFGFSIPNGATILGIKVEVKRSRAAGTAGEVRDKEVRLVRSDGTLGVENKARASQAWPAPDAYATYGGEADLWKETSFSPQEINSPQFGVVVSAIGSTPSTNRTARIDHIAITVTYSKQLYVLDAAAPQNPIFLGGLGSNPVPAGFNSVVSDGTHAYAAVNSAASQLQIIDVSSPNVIVKKTYAVPGVSGGGAVGNTVFYKNGYVYLGLAKTSAGPEFAIIRVRDPASPSFVGGYKVGSGITSVYVRGQYAFLTTDDSHREVIIFDLSNLSRPLFVGTYDAPGALGFGYGRTLYAVGDRLYLGRTYVGNAPEFSILQMPHPPGQISSVLASRDVGPGTSSPYGVYGIVVRDYLSFVLTNSPSKGGEFHIFATDALPNITAPYTLALPNSGKGMALDCEGNYLYAASVPDSQKSSLSIMTAL